MKLIPFVPKVLITDTQRKPAMEQVFDDEGKAVLDDKGTPMLRRATVTQRELFLQRMSDPQLAPAKEPLQAARFSNKLFDAIDAQSDEVVSARGGWLFEDEHADALCRVLRKGPAPSQMNPNGGYPMGTLHNLESMLDAVEKVVTLTAEQHKALLNGRSWAEASADGKPNGAETKALPEAAQA